MGAVYSAQQKSLDRPVAIKVLPRQLGADPNFRASFEAEAKAMAKLNHPNLIGVFDFGDADGMLYIVMELVEGKSLYHSAYGKVIQLVPHHNTSLLKNVIQRFPRWKYCAQECPQLRLMRDEQTHKSSFLILFHHQ